MLKNKIFSQFVKPFSFKEKRLLFEDANNAGAGGDNNGNDANAGGQGASKQEGDQGGDQNNNQGGNQAPESVPYSRFQEVNEQAKQSAEKLAEFERKEKEREEQEALAKGEHEKLINDLKPQAERAKALEETIKTSVNALIEKIPEERRSLIPEGLPVEQKFNWINQNLEFLTQTSGNPNVNTGSNVPNSQDAGNKPIYTQEQISDINFYQKNRDDILLAQKEGRIKD